MPRHDNDEDNDDEEDVGLRVGLINNSDCSRASARGAAGTEDHADATSLNWPPPQQHQHLQRRQQLLLRRLRRRRRLLACAALLAACLLATVALALPLPGVWRHPASGERDGSGDSSGVMRSPAALGLAHDFGAALYRSPSGAVPHGTHVRLRVSVPEAAARQHEVRAVYIRLWDARARREIVHQMRPVRAGANASSSSSSSSSPRAAEPAPSLRFYEYILHTDMYSERHADLFWYRFVCRHARQSLVSGHDTTYFEPDHIGRGGERRHTRDLSWPVLAHKRDFATPAWVHRAVFYQLFPDRFRRRNQRYDFRDADYYGDRSVVHYHEAWNSDLLSLSEAQIRAGATNAEFYGGTLDGVREKLAPYLVRELGIDALYLCPLFESPSNHAYDTADFTRVAARLGGNDAFEALMREAKRAGVRVVLDGVFNHVSKASHYFASACRDPQSAYRSWFTFVPRHNPHNVEHVVADGSCEPPGTGYRAWFGIDTLPALRANDSAGVRAFIYGDARGAIARRWLRGADTGADGWRLDVGNEIDGGVVDDPHNWFWEEFRRAVKAEAVSGDSPSSPPSSSARRSSGARADHDKYIVGECWGYAHSWLLGDEWDGAMNYPLANYVLGFWLAETYVDTNHRRGWSPGPIEPLAPSAFDASMHYYLSFYARPALLAALNSLGTHDTNRVAFMLDPNAPRHTPATYTRPDYDWSRARQRSLAAHTLLLTMPGAPCIFYGDELGLIGIPRLRRSDANPMWESDPAMRQPFPWHDEAGNGGGGKRHGVDLRMRERLKRAIAARRRMPALWRGIGWRTLLVDDARGVYAYARYDDAHPREWAVVLLCRDERRGAAEERMRAQVDVSAFIAAGGSAAQRRLVDVLATSDGEHGATNGASSSSTTTTTYAVDERGRVSLPATYGVRVFAPAAPQQESLG